MAVVVSDTFTDTAKALESHTGETGATWAEHPVRASGAMVVSNANRARCINATISLYYASGDPASNEYDVEGVLHVSSNAGAMGICGRLNTVAETFYMARYNQPTGAWELSKQVAGSGTSLGTSLDTLTVGNDYTVKLEIRDATKKLYVDGVERISSNDNAVTPAGKVGIRGATGTDSTGYHVDSITLTDIAVPAVRNLGLVGVGG